MEFIVYIHEIIERKITYDRSLLSLEKEIKDYIHLEGFETNRELKG